MPGAIRKVSVAVMVDGIVGTGADGTQTWAPRPAEEMETLGQLVRSAIGFDEARGDTVTIESLQFSPAPDQGTLAESTGSGFLEIRGGRLAQLGVLGAIVLALILFVIRPMTARRPVPELAELTGPREIGDARHAPPPQIRSDALLDLPAQTVGKIERLRDVISSRGEDSAAVLRSWIESPDTRKEPAGS